MQEATQALEDILPATERTQTITVIERFVGKVDGKYAEREEPVDVYVRPLPFRRWLTAMKHIGSILQYLPAEGLDLNDVMRSVVYLINVAGQAQDELIALACLATDKEASFFDRIDPDDGVRIIVAVVQVNKDFFVQKVLPLVQEQLPAMTETFGQTQLPS